MPPPPAVTQRDRVAELAPQDPAAAAALARRIEDPYYRAQALGWAARYAVDDAAVLRLARAALDAAGSCEDAYRQVVSSAWPLRASLERGLRDATLEMLEIVLTAVPRIEPAASRAEALMMLYHAVFAVDDQVRRSLLFALAELFDADRHWRVERAFRDALSMSRAQDPDLVARLVAGGGDARRRGLARALAGDALEPRPFYW